MLQRAGVEHVQARGRMSVGASVFPHDGNTYETLLATADSRMYRDKTRRKREGTGQELRPLSASAVSG